MPAIITLPFNFMPIETSVKTSSYTIPAGKYAKVTPFFNSAPDTTLASGATGSTAVTVWNCQLDGTVVLQSDASLEYDVSSSATRTFTGPSQHKAALSVVSGTADITYSGRIIFTGAPTTGTANTVYFLASGANLVIPNTAGNSRGVVQYEFSGSKDISFWAEAGVVLAGSGTFRWLVEEYNVIS